jgi:hypothetical protein
VQRLLNYRGWEAAGELGIAASAGLPDHNESRAGSNVPVHILPFKIMAKY